MKQVVAFLNDSVSSVCLFENEEEKSFKKKKVLSAYSEYQLFADIFVLAKSYSTACALVPWHLQNCQCSLDHSFPLMSLATELL